MKSATQIMVGTTAEWSGENPVLPEGVLAVEIRGNGKRRIKVGDGVKSWGNLDGLELEGGGSNAPSNFYNISFKMTVGQDYLTFGFITNTPHFPNGASGNATFINKTNAEFIAAMKAYFPLLNAVNNVVTIGGAGGYWQGGYVNHISLSMVNSTTLRVALNTSNSAYNFDLTNNTNTPQFAVNVSMIN